jgi:plasmid stabilization system protein ParE
MSYEVEVTDRALKGIQEIVHYIAVDQAAPLNAQGWLEGLWDAIDSLQHFPRRCARAEEDRFRPFELRKLVHESLLILFTIDDEKQTVFVLGVRHGMRLPRPEDLPEDPQDIGNT